MIKIFGKKVALITAHPDDESFVFAGICDSVIENGGKVDLFCATRGGNGYKYDENQIEEISITRSAELAKACDVLGVNLKYLGDFQDGELYGSVDHLFTELKNILKNSTYDSIVSFNADGYTGHLDHIACFDVAKKLSFDLKIPFYTACKSHKIKENLHDALIKKRKSQCYQDFIDCSCVDQITIKVNQEKKLKAIKTHKSQEAGLDPSLLLGKDCGKFMEYEYYCLK